MFKLFLSKKGQEETEMTIIPTFALVIVFGVIFIGLISFVDDIRDNSLFEKMFLARDLAILIDTLYVAPGSVDVNYLKDTFWFSYHFAPGKVEVYDETDGIDLRRETYFFVEDNNIFFEEKELSYEEEPEKKVQLRFLKSEDRIEVKEGIGVDGIPKILCPKLESVETVEGKTLFTPALIPLSHLGNREFKEKVKGAFVAVISYAGSDIDSNVNNIIAYVFSSSPKMKESRRMACLILNEIISNEELKKIIEKNNLNNITGINVALTDGFDILEQGNIAILLKIGNKEIEKEKNILENEEAMQAIMGSINKGIEKYD